MKRWPVRYAVIVVRCLFYLFAIPAKSQTGFRHPAYSVQSMLKAPLLKRIDFTLRALKSVAFSGRLSAY